MNINNGENPVTEKNNIGTLNLMGDESIEPAGDAWFAAVALDSSGNKLWTYFEDDFGMRALYDR